MKQNYSDAHNISAFIQNLQFSDRMGLESVQAVLKKWGGQSKFPPIFHVAGTNGKGSVSAFLVSCLKSMGISVHSYTSPHLVSYTERIRLNGKTINENDLLYCLKEACDAADPHFPLSPFEALTSAAFYAFMQHPAQAWVIEVGLGGRLDATNVIEKPCISIITPISYDHCDKLGPTLTHIATEKAGIFKSQVPCVISQQNPEAAKILREKAAEKSCPLFEEGIDWEVLPLLNLHENPKGLMWKSGNIQIIIPSLSLIGEHQKHNAGTALMALKTQKHFSYTHDQLIQGLNSTYWPARLERIKENLFFDGAHNIGGAEVLAQHIATHWKERKVTIVLGMLKRKDIQGFWHILAPWVERVYIHDTFHEDAAPFDLLKHYANSTSTPCFEYLDADLDVLCQDSDLVLCCGSLYFIGYLMQKQGIFPAERDQ